MEEVITAFTFHFKSYLDAAVNGGGDNSILLADDKGANVDDALKVRTQHFAEFLRLQGPDVQLLANPRYSIPNWGGQ
jgi:hypothetical protein